VTILRTELSKLPSLITDLVETALHLLRCKALYWQVTSASNQIVLWISPTAMLEPTRNVEN
jgi:hypothetical protein